MDLTTLTGNLLVIIACAVVIGGGRIPTHSHPSDIKFLAGDPHLKKQSRLLAATCDCNKQGPWKPVFKPSYSDQHGYHHHGLRQDSREAIVKKLKAHGFDVGDDPSVNNHLIHLHLIPHIYVPIMHPVSYQVHEEPQEHNSNDISSSSEEPHHTTPASSAEETGSTSGGSFEDTSQQTESHGGHHDHGHGLNHGHGHGHGTHNEDNGQFYTIPPEAYNNEVHEDHIQHYHHIYDPTNSVEDLSAFDIPKDKNHHLVVSSTTPVHHQYEVHEDPSKDNFLHSGHPNKENFLHSGHPSKDSFLHSGHFSKDNFLHSGQFNNIPGQFNNIPEGSNNAPQLYQPLQPLLYINKKPYLRIPVPAVPQAARHRYMRKLMSRQDMEKLKTMRPPSLGQKQTWSAPPPPRPKIPPIIKLPPTIKLNSLNSPVPPLNRYSFAHRPKLVYYVNIKKKSDRRKK